MLYGAINLNTKYWNIDLSIFHVSDFILYHGLVLFTIFLALDYKIQWMWRMEKPVVLLLAKLLFPLPTRKKHLLTLVWFLECKTSFCRFLKRPEKWAGETVTEWTLQAPVRITSPMRLSKSLYLFTGFTRVIIQLP